MSNSRRVAVAFTAALLIGAASCGDNFDLHQAGVLGELVYSTAAIWVIVALLVLTVALVNRWWALSVALVPLAVEFFLHSATGYVYPYHEDPYPAIAVAGTLLLLGVSSFGFLLRALLDRVAYKHLISGLKTKHG